MARLKRSISAPKDFSKAPIGRVSNYQGIFVAFVKDNRDAHKLGRLKVWIPELGSDPSDENGWLVVQYASPFAGATPFRFTGSNPQEIDETQTSYGFWFVPPDVDNQVLVTFINGDSTRGIWFACLYQTYMNNMVPGFSAVNSNEHYGPETTTDNSPLPVGEYNKNVVNRNFKTPDSEKKPINTHKASGLRDQGLVFDSVRGYTKSSARRSTPSEVYGISTPGPIDEFANDNFPYESYLSKGQEQRTARRGGHSFVMDDNDASEHISLKTRSGAQIRIDQTNGIIYLNNRDGTAWLEFSESGHVDVYGAKSFSVRSEEDINFRADRDINIEAGRNVNMKASKDYLSPDDLPAFLASYANTQNRTIDQLFTEQQKRDFISDDEDLRNQLLSGQGTVNELFFQALSRRGLPTRGTKDLIFEPGQEFPSATSLQSVELLHLLRQSNIVGEFFGSGGEIRMQANANIDIYAEREAKVTVAEGDLDLFAGSSTVISSGTDMSIVSGTEMKVTSGTEMSVTSGTDLKQMSGGNYEINVLGDMNATLRGEVKVLLEGLKLNIEAKPTEFTGTGRAPSSQDHNTTMTLHNFSVRAKTHRTSLTDGDWLVSAPNGNARIYGQSARMDAQLIAVVKAPGLDTTTPGTGSVLNINISNLNLPIAERPEVGDIATLATTPVLYSKSNVLPVLAPEGNKEFSITYHRQEIESIVPRFMTREPCIEHENTGGNETYSITFRDHLKFRIV